jgi:hypothetical protein
MHHDDVGPIDGSVETHEIAIDAMDASISPAPFRLGPRRARVRGRSVHERGAADAMREQFEAEDANACADIEQRIARPRDAF